MFMKGFRYVLSAPEGDGTGSGGAGGGAGAGAEGEGAGADTSGQQPGAAAGAADGGQGQGSVLQQGGEGHPAPGIPDKYQVKKDDGTIDLEASSLKLAEAYGHLEKRLGSGDVPPKTVEDYAINVPDAVKDVFDAKDPMLGAFLKDAHAAGFTQKQVDLAIAKYTELAPALLAGNAAVAQEECVAALRAEWKTDEQYKAEVGNAYKAAVGYFGSDADYIIKTHGNDPILIKGLAKIGAEMSEDRSATPVNGGMASGQSIEALMTSKAYNDPKDPDHARVSAIVSKHFEAQAAAAEKAGAAPLL